MTRIDFHSNVADKLHYTLRLVRKARATDNKIVLMAAPQELAALDAALWALSAEEFLPHVNAGDTLASQTPIILTEDDSVDLPHRQILINLSGQTPADFSRFERLIEIVGTEANDVTAARLRYRSYLELGCKPTHHIAK